MQILSKLCWERTNLIILSLSIFWSLRWVVGRGGDVGGKSLLWKKDESIFRQAILKHE